MAALLMQQGAGERERRVKLHEKKEG
uniref:Uncharacterized protein n=1 Tax=Arundo donax TaxID=35708 RepID=A0A0A8XZ01_ARUDO